MTTLKNVLADVVRAVSVGVGAFVVQYAASGQTHLKQVAVAAVLAAVEAVLPAKDSSFLSKASSYLTGLFAAKITAAPPAPPVKS